MKNIDEMTYEEIIAELPGSVRDKTQELMNGQPSNIAALFVDPKEDWIGYLYKQYGLPEITGFYWKVMMQGGTLIENARNLLKWVRERNDNQSA